MFLLPALLALSLPPALVGGVKSFGTGNAGSVCGGRPVSLFHHQISAVGHVGLMSHFWTTGTAQEQLAAAGIELQITYTFDDEVDGGAPSTHNTVSFDPAKAAGQFFGAVNFSGTWEDGTRAATANNLSLFSAGDKIGKNAVVEGWWHQTKMPFRSTVDVNVSVVDRETGGPAAATKCAAYYVVVRGYETAAASLVLPSGFAIPLAPSRGARLELHATDLVAAPNAFVPLLTVPPGREALLYQLGLGLETSPPWGTQDPTTGKLVVRNNYVEGCWSLLRTHNETLPGQVLGTGLEDFWDSGYGFSIVDPGKSAAGLPPSTDTDGEIRRCRRDSSGRDAVCPVTGSPFQHPSAGILHFSSDYTAQRGDAGGTDGGSGGSGGSDGDGVERLSAYRFFDAEVVGMDDGGSFGWTNGCAAWNKPGTNKCGLPTAPSAREALLGACKTSPTRVRALVWVYTWEREG